MIRTIVTPEKQRLSIYIPKKFVGKRMEIIAFPIDEPNFSDRVETHFASESVLSKDWLTPEEDRAWAHL
jgi:hypothetical protein